MNLAPPGGKQARQGDSGDGILGGAILNNLTQLSKDSYIGVEFIDGRDRFSVSSIIT
jgi:hypothetical protein